MTCAAVIVGAGPTGVLAAIELARRGVDVRILERQDARSAESRAIGIHARSLELLHQVGAVEEFLDLGHRVGGFSWYSPERRIVHMRFDNIDSPYPFLLTLSQAETQRILDEHLMSLGVGIERGVEVVGLTQDDGGVELVARDASSGVERRIGAEWCVGCDGAHSVVRELIGVAFDGDGYGQDWLMAELDVQWSRPAGEFYVFVGSRGTLATFPLSPRRWRFFMPQVPDRAGGRPSPDLDEIDELVRQRGPKDVEIGNPSLLACFRSHRRSAASHRSGRVFLAGDAVHIHSPAGGQGMNTGLQDAFNLGWKLGSVITGRGSPSLLDSYQPERAPVAASVLRLTHGLVQLSNPRTRRGHVLRNALGPVVSAIPPVQRRATRRMAQLAFTYRDGPLAGHGTTDSRATLRPGDRVPHIEGLVSGGAPISLLDLLAHPEHTLLVLTGTARNQITDVPDIAAGSHDHVRTVVICAEAGGRVPGAVIDTVHRAHTLFRAARGRAVLIRPDGHIAGFTSLEQQESLTRADSGRPLSGPGS